jgi:hypothetical protein
MPASSPTASSSSRLAAWNCSCAACNSAAQYLEVMTTEHDVLEWQTFKSIVGVLQLTNLSQLLFNMQFSLNESKNIINRSFWKPKTLQLLEEKK